MAAAQYNLGRYYSDGEFVAVNWAEAVRWFRKAAEPNLAVAQRDLGNCYFSGQGVKQDSVTAVKWYRKSAEQR
ncbi:MAG: tetratricopeptide repeat protein [Verrucomicrobia bacterium]|nr:tetratricopeptide repeat protein [Verrucomicrobiota bacterium]